MYKLLLVEKVEKTFSKLQKKDNVKYEQIMQKLEQLLNNPYAGKPLRNLMKGKWRVHIGEHVLIYEINQNEMLVKVIEYEHHDSAYK